MRRPDQQGMVRARAEIDEHLNKVLVLLAMPPDAEEINSEEYAQIITAQMDAARKALIRFEDACYA